MEILRKIFYVLISLSAFNINAQTSWFPLSSGTTAQIEKSYFANSMTGYAVGNYGTILKSTNGGINWAQQSAGTTDILLGLFFTDSLTGYASGRNIYKTTNGGSNWNINFSGNGFFLMQSIFFINRDKGYICGSKSQFGLILKTSNAGVTWDTTLLSVPGNEIKLYDIHFTDENNGIVCGTRAIDPSFPIVYKTTNGGLTWENKTPSVTGLTYYYLTSVKMVGNNIIYTSGTMAGFFKAVLLKSTNGGTNWTALIPGNAYHGFTSCFFLNENLGYFVGAYGDLYKTTDGGSSFISSSITSLFLRHVFFQNLNVGYIVGESGIILKTIDGGITFVNSSDETTKSFSLSQNYPNPFNPQTRINYELPITNFVSIKVYDALGNEIETLVNEKQNAGSYAVDFNASLYGSSLPSGIYFYKLVTEKFSETKKMILIK